MQHPLQSTRSHQSLYSESMEHMQALWYESFQLLYCRWSCFVLGPIDCVECHVSAHIFRLTIVSVSLQYTAAAKTNALDSVSKALISLNQILKSDTKLPIILRAPTLSDGDKSQIIQELEKHTGGADKGGTVKNFLQTLAENNRLGILEGVCDKFSTLMSAYKGEIELVITSASVRDLISSEAEAAGLAARNFDNEANQTPRNLMTSS